jgi:polysaccharide export outer membrane protein
MKPIRFSFLGWLLVMLFSLGTNPVSASDASATAPADKTVPAQPEVESPNSYRLKAGDALEVSVWHDETLHKQLKVLPDGSITFPLAGRIDVAGLTTAQVETKVTDKLRSYLEDPVVTVVISGIDGNRVYILGNVIKPGPVILDAPMTILQALSLAGGLAKFADEDAIKILRPSSDGIKTLVVRYGDLIKAKNLSTNHPLMAGDTILVP